MSAHGHPRALVDAALADNNRIDEHAPGLFRMSGTMVLIGALLSALACMWHSERFWSAYLVAFAYLLSITLGGLFFVIVQHLVKTGWSVVVRRVSECVTMNFGVLFVLFIPLIIGMSIGYLHPKASLKKGEHHAAAPADHGKAGTAAHVTPVAHLKGDWKHGPTIEHAVHPKLAKDKQAWLSLKWVLIRVCLIYFPVWFLLSLFFYRNSVAQDTSKDPALTGRMQFWAAPAMLLFALTCGLGGFDLLMALDPYWYSTIFGVYFWAGGFVSFCAALILILVLLQKNGILTKSVSVEHYHDVGKFMFAWIVFWAYVAYSQYMLIWYGNIPEESVWYLIRQTGGWAWVGMVGLVIGHFILPFLLLMSRFPKRRPNLLMVGAIYVLVVHFIDLFWIVQPQKSMLGHVPAPLLDVFVLIALLGIYIASTVHNLRGVPLIPVGDPRLAESLHHETF